MTPARRYTVAALKWIGFSWCLLNIYLWSSAGEWLWLAIWLPLSGVYCWLIGRSTQPRPVRQRPDYARIAQLERELGLHDPEATP